MPPCWSLPRSLAQEDVFPAQPVKIETAKCKERIVEPVLIFEHESRKWVIRHYSVVIRTSQAFKKAMADCEERHVLNVWIVFSAVGYDVVDVVVSLPPANGQAAQKVGDEDPDTSVNMKIVCYAHVAGIMDGENELMP